MRISHTTHTAVSALKKNSRFIIVLAKRRMRWTAREKQ
jgi:hypothetical protein